MMAFGLTMVSVALFYMTSFDLSSISGRWLRRACCRAAGLGFLFVPINTVAYSFLPPEKNNAASGIINLSRNVGASVGISIVTTMLDRRQQFHLSRMSSHLSAGSPQVQSMLQGTAHALESRGFSAADAMHRAYGLLQGNLIPPGHHVGLH